MQLLASEVNVGYYTHRPGIVSLLMLTITYILHTLGRINNYMAHSLYMTMVTATSVMGVVKIGNFVPRVGIEPTYQASWTSVILLHHIY